MFSSTHDLLSVSKVVTSKKFNSPTLSPLLIRSLYRRLFKEVRDLDANPLAKFLFPCNRELQELTGQRSPLYVPNHSYVDVLRKVFRDINKVPKITLAFDTLNRLRAHRENLLEKLPPVIKEQDALIFSLKEEVKKHANLYRAEPFPLVLSKPSHYFRPASYALKRSLIRSNNQSVELAKGVVLVAHPLSSTHVDRRVMMITEYDDDITSAVVLDLKFTYPLSIGNPMFPEVFWGHDVYDGGYSQIGFTMPPTAHITILHTLEPFASTSSSSSLFFGNKFMSTATSGNNSNHSNVHHDTNLSSEGQRTEYSSDNAAAADAAPLSASLSHSSNSNNLTDTIEGKSKSILGLPEMNVSSFSQQKRWRNWIDRALDKASLSMSSSSSSSSSSNVDYKAAQYRHRLMCEPLIPGRVLDDGTHEPTLYASKVEALPYLAELAAGQPRSSLRVYWGSMRWPTEQIASEVANGHWIAVNVSPSFFKPYPLESQTHEGRFPTLQEIKEGKETRECRLGLIVSPPQVFPPDEILRRRERLWDEIMYALGGEYASLVGCNNPFAATAQWSIPQILAPLTASSSASASASSSGSASSSAAASSSSARLPSEADTVQGEEKESTFTLTSTPSNLSSVLEEIKSLRENNDDANGDDDADDDSVIEPDVEEKVQEMMLEEDEGVITPESSSESSSLLESLVEPETTEVEFDTKVSKVEENNANNNNNNSSSVDDDENDDIKGEFIVQGQKLNFRELKRILRNLQKQNDQNNKEGVTVVELTLAKSDGIQKTQPERHSVNAFTPEKHNNGGEYNETVDVTSADDVNAKTHSNVTNDIRSAKRDKEEENVNDASVKPQKIGSRT